MNDQIKFSCLACGQHIECDVTESGRSMLCPNCHANLTVPRVMEMDTVPEPEPSTPITPPPVLGAKLPEEAAVTGFRTSKLAIASLVCSLTCLCLPGILFGHLAKARIRRDPKLQGRDMAIAGLIISYVTLLLAVLAFVFIFILPMILPAGMSLLLLHQMQKQLATNSIVITQSPSTSVTNSDEQAVSMQSGPGWTMDVKTTGIPESPVTGQIHGQNFEFKKAIFHAGYLKFESADSAEYVVIRGLKDIAGNIFEVDPNATDNVPKVEIAWGDNGQNTTQSFTIGYAMELKFDPAKKRKVSGHIYLCLPDDSKSYIAGTFTVTLPKPKPAAN